MAEQNEEPERNGRESPLHSPRGHDQALNDFPARSEFTGPVLRGLGLSCQLARLRPASAYTKVAETSDLPPASGDSGSLLRPHGREASAAGVAGTLEAAGVS